jgi:2-desacetyl-2-hydroxyethyl bacteriochlorophyllide A dehydrogenase
MRAAAWMSPERLDVLERASPMADNGQAVIDVAACGICGSDLHSFRHGLAVRPGQVLGHEFCGTVTEAPGVEGLDVGDRVVVRPLIPCGECTRCLSGEWQLCEGSHASDIGYRCAGAFAERVLVPRAVVGETVFLLPSSVDDAAGALVEPLAVGLHAVRVARVRPGDLVLVLGAGMIGLAVTRLLKVHGAPTVAVAEPSRLRRSRARALGADLVLDPEQEDITLAMQSLTGPGGYGAGARVDAVFECAGAPAAIATAMRCARQGGTIVLAGIYGREVAVQLDRIVVKELRIQGTAGYRDEFAGVISLLASGELRAEQFVSHSFPLDQITEAFRTQMDAGVSLKVQVSPGIGT